MLKITKRDILNVGTSLAWSEKFGDDTGILAPNFIEGITEVILNEVLALFGEDHKIHTKEDRTEEGMVVFWTTVQRPIIEVLAMIPDDYAVLLNPEDEAFEDDTDDGPEDGRWNFFGEAE